MPESILKVVLQGDATKLNASLKTASSRLESFGKKVQGIGKSMSIYVTAPITLAGGAAIKFASDFEESLNKVDVAFKNSSGGVRDFAKTTLESFGIAEGTALDMAALFGDMSTSMGLSTNEAANLSTSLVGLAGDLSSFKNMNIEEVTTALNGVFTGETESLKRLGIVMTEVNLQQFALEQGITKSIKKFTQAEKVQLRYNYVMSKTANAQGDFARTSGGAANQMRIFQETLKELGVSFGQIILPLFTKIVVKLNAALDVFRNLDESTKLIILGVAGLAAAAGPLIYAFGVLSTIVGAILSPIGLVAAALAAVAYVIYKNWNEVAPVIVGFYNHFVDLYNGSLDLRLSVAMLGAALKTAFNLALLPIKQLIISFETLWSLIQSASGANDMSFVDILKTGFDKQLENIKNFGKEAGETFAEAYNDALTDQMEKKTVEQLNAGISNAVDYVKDKFSNLFGSKKSGTSQQKNSSSLDESFAVKNPLFNDNITLPLDNVLFKFEILNEKTKELKDTFGGYFNEISTGLINSFEAMLSGESFFNSFANMLQSLLKRLLATAAAAAVLSALLGGFGGNASLVEKFGFKKIFGELSGLKIGGGATAFANGGIVSSPTLGLVGEYAGARSNPEVIAPLDKLKSLLGDTGGNSVQVGGEFKLRGDDLYVSLERTKKRRNRIG